MEKYSADKKFVVMTRDEVRAFDSWAINEVGIPGVVLMENAGRSCAELIKEKLAEIVSPKVCIFCGTGNNGGEQQGERGCEDKPGYFRADGRAD
ncbi:MAG: NAD(P)H-hydrate epimerase [Planctomycetota bacterium]|jgi:hypothetical protein